MHNRTRRTVASLVIAALLACAVVVGMAAPAQAFSTVFPLHGPHKAVEYGQSWQIYSYDYYGGGDLTLIATVNGVDTEIKYGYDNGNILVFSNDGNDGNGPLSKTLSAGTYMISLRLTSHSGVIARSDAAFKLVIAPAPITTTTLITPDANNPRNAVVSAELSGDYIDGLPNCYCEGDTGNYLPGGTWRITVTGANGKVVFRREETAAAGKLDASKAYAVIGGDPFFVAYWSNLPPGEGLTATSSFTPTAAHSKNFTMSSTPFSYTSAGAVAGATPTATPTASAATTTASNGLPFWVLLAALILVILLLLLDVILLILRSRRRGNAVPSAAAPIAEGGVE